MRYSTLKRVHRTEFTKEGSNVRLSDRNDFRAVQRRLGQLINNVIAVFSHIASNAQIGTPIDKAIR
jgi:hypothetical protein